MALLDVASVEAAKKMNLEPDPNQEIGRNLIEKISEAQTQYATRKAGRHGKCFRRYW